MNKDYATPVDKLLGLGEPENTPSWPNYLELGFKAKDIPELICMVQDMQLNQADEGSPLIWAPLHAWRALGQLGAEESIEPLIKFCAESDGEDWAMQEIPIVLGMIGIKALPSLQESLADVENGTDVRGAMAEGMSHMVTKHSETRGECIQVLITQLEKYEDNDPELNGFIIFNLLELQATEALQIMEKAFKADCVDEFIAGDWEDVQISLGIKKERDTPPPEFEIYLDEPDD